MRLRLALCLQLFITGFVAAQAPPITPQSAAPANFVPEGFQLDPVQQAYLDQVLTAWESESGKVQNFQCPFTRFEYNAFGPDLKIHFTQCDGQLSYQQPDKGSFQITSTYQWMPDPVPPGYQGPPLGKHVLQPNEVGEHWVCDGNSIFEYKTDQKELHERVLPEELKGKRIVDGPLPFLFGAEAAKLKARYWLRLLDSKDANVIHIEAMPKYQADAANYSKVELRLDRTKLMPMAMQVSHPGGQSRAAYVFDLSQATVNSRVTSIFGGLFQSPRTPFGWKRVVEQPPAAQAAAPQALPKR